MFCYSYFTNKLTRVYTNCVMHRLTQVLKLIGGIAEILKKKQFLQNVPNRWNRDKIYGANILNIATVERGEGTRLPQFSMDSSFSGM